MRKCLIALGWMSIAGWLWGAAPTPLEGKWKLDVAESSTVLPWTDITLEITAQGDTLRLHRKLFWTVAKQGDETIIVKPDDRTVTASPLSFWLDGGYNNAYLGGDHQARAVAGWLDHGRILRVDLDVALLMQQGDYPVHVHREYRLSSDRKTLRVFELRSTRDQALTFVYHRL